MSKFIVTANYKDRQSPEMWLVRKADESIDNAVPCKRVRMCGVRFETSSIAEAGFGCFTVAVCDSAEVVPDDAPVVLGERPLVFDGAKFTTARGTYVGQAREMQLHANGAIDATLM